MEATARKVLPTALEVAVVVHDAEEAKALWMELWEGRWVVSDVTTEDGFRKLLLKRPRKGRTRGITERERVALELTVEGRPLKHIAHALGSSLSTASDQLQSALRKLGLSDRLEVVQWMAREAL